MFPAGGSDPGSGCCKTRWARAFDPCGVVFGVALDGTAIRGLDLRIGHCSLKLPHDCDPVDQRDQ
jgi:hypothetical protein